MNLTTLKYVITVCEILNVTKVAQMYYISQQALSKAIQNTESFLGAKLFLRTSQGLVLTECGRHFYEIVSPLAKELDQAIVTFKNECATRINVGFSESAILRIGSSALDGFISVYPEIDIDLTQGPDENIIMGVLNGDLELAFCQTPIGYNSSLKFVPVIDEALYAIVNEKHPLASNREIHIQDLRGVKLLRLKRKESVFQSLDVACSKAGFKTEYANSFFEVGLLKEIPAKTDCVFICPKYYATMLPEGVVRVPFAESELMFHIGYVHIKGNKLSSQCNRLISYIVDTIQADTSAHTTP